MSYTTDRATASLIRLEEIAERLTKVVERSSKLLANGTEEEAREVAIMLVSLRSEMRGDRFFRELADAEKDLDALEQPTTDVA